MGARRLPHTLACRWRCTCPVEDGHTPRCLHTCTCGIFKRKLPAQNFEDELHGTPLDSDTGDRPSRDRVLLDVAKVISQRGTCSRAQVGAVIATDGRIITTGYNGAPSGMPHCVHDGEDHIPRVVGTMVDDPGKFRLQPGRLIELTSEMTLTYVETPGCTIAEHAERNAIAYAARYGLRTDQSTLYCTHGPCVDCARAIINAGIIRVCYEIPYRKTEGVELLAEAGVEVIRLYKESK